MSKDPWEKAYVYGRDATSTVAHVLLWPNRALCGDFWTDYQNCTPKPYPVCKKCLKTKRAKELGLLDRPPNPPRLANWELP